MKFGAKLKTFTVPEWSDKYVRYKELSRLAKRARNIKTGKAAGVEDDEERSILTNAFTVETVNESTSNNTALTRFGSRLMPDKSEQSQMRLNRAASDIHVTYDDILVDIIPEDELPSFLAGMRTESSTTTIPQDEATQELSDAITDIIKLVNEQYDHDFHLSFQTLRHKAENLPQLNRLLACLDKAEEKAEKQKYPNKGEIESNGTLRDLSISQLRLSSIEEEVAESREGGVAKSERKDGSSELRNRRYDSSASTNKSACRVTHGCFKFCSTRRVFHPIKRRFNLTKYTPLLQDEALSTFHKVLREDIRTVITHYVTEMEYINSLVRFLRADITRRGKLDEAYASLIRKACTAFWDSCDKLKLYLHINVLAVYKVLKKKDKLLETYDVFTLYPTYKNVMLSIDVSAKTVDDVAQIYNSLMDNKIVEFTELKKDMEATLDSMRTKPAHGLFFAYGLCTVLFLNSLFLCSFSFKFEFDVDILISQVATFRLFFIMSLVWLGFGWCQNFLETYGVNYQFQFGLSSNYAASENDYYYLGVFQMFSCLMLFVAFVLDCKLHIIPQHNHYWVYPILLILISVVVCVWPNENMKLKMRKKLLFAVLRVLGAPFGVGKKVTLADSIIADVMTSLTRSFRDLVYMITYFIVGVTSNKMVVPFAVRTWVIPVIMCYPYFIRFSQCLRRYSNEKRWLHIGNMVKYITSIWCVIASTLDWEELLSISTSLRNGILISIYVAATLIQCWWDFVVDWGLDISWNMFKTRKDRCMYQRKAYYTAVVFNMVCRCTWALTTTPFALMRNQELSSAILSVIISVIEIVRRIVWVTFRLESEHLLNSYKYRTALWVPKLYNCKNLIVKEMKMLNEQL